MLDFADKELVAFRLETCRGCERLFKPTMSCKECGCFVKLKARLEHDSCPLGKW
jgi:rRNA maturation endonuclease Nob1